MTLLDAPGARSYAFPVVPRVVLLVLAFALGSCARSDPDAIPGVRLGMSPRDVRDRFDTAGQGGWQTNVGVESGDTVLSWTSIVGSSQATVARFEFHLGMLVAIRAHLRQATSPGGERVELTPKTVTLQRSSLDAGTYVTVLARDCPTHRAEAEALAAKAR